MNVKSGVLNGISNARLDTEDSQHINQRGVQVHITVVCSSK